MSIIKPSTAFKQSADWVSGEVRAYMRDQVATHVDTVQDVRDNDFEQTRFVYVRERGAVYRLDLASGAADNGNTVIGDNVGRRYIKIANGERGSNANGEYERFANGLQICRVANVSATFVTTSRLAYSWTFPAAFVSGGYSGAIVLSAVSWDGSGRDALQSHHHRMDQITAAGARFSLICAGNFLSGDTGTLRLTTIGRWF